MKKKMILSFYSLILTLAVVGCSGSPEPADRYQTRGIVTKVGPHSVSILHEEIKSYRNGQGKEIGMKVMVMSFGLGRGVSTKDIQRGDKVSVLFTSDWNRTPGLRIERLKKLPPKTELNLDGFEVEFE